MDTRHCRALFLELSHAALRAGLMDQWELDLLRRSHSRKSGYWCRHFNDLLATLERRLSARFWDRRLDSLRRAVAEYAGSE